MLRHARMLILIIGTCTTWVTGSIADESDAIKQYKAAVTRIFLWRYQAFPLFRHESFEPGDVIQINNETKFLSNSTCYPNIRGGHPKNIQSFKEGQSVNANLSMQIGGVLLSEKIAEAKARGSVDFDHNVLITADPVAIDEVRPDVSALRGIYRKEECKIIQQLLDGKAGKYMIAAAVLRGRINAVMSGSFSANLDASLRGKLIASVAKTFGVKEADIQISGRSISFSVAESPGDLSLAIVPAQLNFQEVARITGFLQGKRGADLQAFVEAALEASDPSTFKILRYKILELLGKEEFSRGDTWADHLVNGNSTPEQAQVSLIGEKDRKLVADYAAALVLVGTQ